CVPGSARRAWRSAPGGCRCRARSATRSSCGRRCPARCRHGCGVEAGPAPDRGDGTMTHASPAVLLAVARVSGEVVPARAQMATTLGFHIILACLGIALPSVVLLAEFIGLRRHDETALRLARHWSQAMGVLIAVAAVTRTLVPFG